MGRVLGFLFVATLILAGIAFGTDSPADAQDGSAATISALQTKNAEYRDRLDSKSTQIAELKSDLATVKARLFFLEATLPTATPTPDSNVIRITGNGNQASKKFTISVPGTYLLTAQNLNDNFLAVDVYSIAADWKPGFSISTLQSGEYSAAGYLDAGDYYIKTVANGGWIVTIEPFQ